jgi:hypothetical protein
MKVHPEDMYCLIFVVSYDKLKTYVGYGVGIPLSCGYLYDMCVCMSVGSD